MRVALGLLVVGAIAGCSVVLDPERYDDVERCRYDDDCSAPDDPRYENICTVSEEYFVEDEEPDIDFPRICSPRPSVSCDPDDYAYDSAFRTRTREAIAQHERYASPCIEMPGAQGCPPHIDDGCTPGLVVHPLSGRCDDEDPTTPPAVAPEPTVILQDVLDQFCRSVYCDIEYACHTRRHRCEPCVLGEPLGRGGCGDLYPAGARSSVYETPDELDAGCSLPDDVPHDAHLGELEAPIESDGGMTGGTTGGEDP
jgi:hypothetical protein